jgi:hypothetical protein
LFLYHHFVLLEHPEQGHSGSEVVLGIEMQALLTECEGASQGLISSLLYYLKHFALSAALEKHAEGMKITICVFLSKVFPGREWPGCDLDQYSSKPAKALLSTFSY